MSLVAILQQLWASLKATQGNFLVIVDLEERVQARDLEKVSHSLVDLDPFHLASPLSDSAETSHQFPHATAVHVVHSREIDQESLVAGTGENVYQVPQLRAALAGREFANNVHYNHSVELSCGDFHGEFARFCFSPCGIIHSLALAFNEVRRRPTERVRSARVWVSGQ
jgi:hypothetical protein